MRYLVVLSVLMLSSCAVFKGGAKVNKETRAIIGTSWTLDILADFKKEATPKQITMNFYKDGKVSGTGTCNSYYGQYKIEGDSITFSRIISTKMACLPGMQTENKFFGVLNDANEYLLTHESLLLKKDGKTLASFSRVKKEQ
jgi:heat shock protein HslJ